MPTTTQEKTPLRAGRTVRVYSNYNHLEDPSVLEFEVSKGCCCRAVKAFHLRGGCGDAGGSEWNDGGIDVEVGDTVGLVSQSGPATPAVWEVRKRSDAAVTPFLELIPGEIPRLHVEIRFHPATGIGAVHRTLMHFRRYDWDYTSDPAGEHSYGGGLNICNGGGFMFATTSVAEFTAITLAVTVDRMFRELRSSVGRLTSPQGVEYARYTAAEKELSYQGRRAVETAFEAARPALQVLLEDAVAHPSEYFSRVVEGYRGGRSATWAPVETRGFQVEAIEQLWLKKEAA